jgi:hypothetical protein
MTVAESVRLGVPIDVGSGLVGMAVGALFFIVFATLFGFLPSVIGAASFVALCRRLPERLIRMAAMRLLLGGLIGALVSFPFAHVMNWIPSGTDEPRFNHMAMLVGSIVAGGYCALCYTHRRE